MDKDFDRDQALEDLIDLMNESKGNVVETQNGEKSIQASYFKSKDKLVLMFDLDDFDDDEEDHDSSDDDEEKDWRDVVAPLSEIIDIAARQAELDRKSVVDDLSKQLDAIDAVVDTVEKLGDKDNDGIIDIK